MFGGSRRTSRLWQVSSDAAPDREVTPEQFMRRAEMLADLGRYDEAAAELGYAIALDPASGEALTLLARRAPGRRPPSRGAERGGPGVGGRPGQLERAGGAGDGPGRSAPVRRGGGHRGGDPAAGHGGRRSAQHRRGDPLRVAQRAAGAGRGLAGGRAGIRNGRRRTWCSAWWPPGWSCSSSRRGRTGRPWRSSRSWPRRSTTSAWSTWSSGASPRRWGSSPMPPRCARPTRAAVRSVAHGLRRLLTSGPATR